MRLAVIGDTQHYRNDDGELCALEPVVNQLDRWAELFDEVVLCAPLADGPPPKGFAPYRSSNFRIEPVPSGGGNDLRSKLAMLKLIGPWARTTRRIARSVDAVHLRCPCNIGLVAILSTWRAVPRRYAMYAGVWHGYRGEPRFYRLQRRLLASRLFGGPVSIYGHRDPTRPHLEPSFSPSFSLDDWRAAEPTVEAKLSRIGDGSDRGPWRLVTVGRLTPNKNQATVVRAVALMVGSGLDVELSVYGDGPCRGDLEALAAELGIGERVEFHGHVDHGDVMAAFAAADLNLLATRQEGFGKVLLEGMVHGTVPVFAESPAAGEISGDGTRGVVIPPDDAGELASAVAGLVADRARWIEMVRAARDYSSTVTLDAFQARVREVLERHWKIALRPDESRRAADPESS
jgi:glycosyltransferase involved in cell wall biosynthesis